MRHQHLHFWSLAVLRGPSRYPNSFFSTFSHYLGRWLKKLLQQYLSSKAFIPVRAIGKQIFLYLYCVSKTAVYPNSKKIFSCLGCVSFKEVHIIYC
jgi:hypothetical protein